MNRPPVPGSFRPGPAGQPSRLSAPAADRPTTVPTIPAGADGEPGSGHPAVDAALRSIVNAVGLSPTDQIAQYEAAHRTLRETLANIDQA